MPLSEVNDARDAVDISDAQTVANGEPADGTQQESISDTEQASAQNGSGQVVDYPTYFDKDRKFASAEDAVNWVIADQASHGHSAIRKKTDAGVLLICSCHGHYDLTGSLKRTTTRKCGCKWSVYCRADGTPTSTGKQPHNHQLIVQSSHGFVKGGVDMRATVISWLKSARSIQSKKIEISVLVELVNKLHGL